jgi:2-keto-4-pentenoate hydratase/2-oxohepta-3-ene-1,7-dioic acid hydratase in catechol pathway
VRFGTVRTRDTERAACLLTDTTGILLPRELGDLVTTIERGNLGPAAVRALAAAPGAEHFELSQVQALAPIRRFHRDILCTGWNYWDHFYESEGKREGQDVPKPDAPTFFTKGPDVVIGPTDDISFDPKVSAKWDYEAEIVVIIGKTGRSIPRDRAMEHVFGYCLANDVSQRDLQRRHGGQWLKGKSIDGTMPLGPWIVPRNEVDLSQVTLECDLNGKRMQQASASTMAFGVDELIAELSFGMTLRAGDVLLTGTPSGIGNARTPPVFLAEGDQLIVRASGLGELRNTVRGATLSAYRAP